ncbi:MAG: dihydrolipoamide acetyltransferase family protein [Deltaproteobacteria bacterium]|nr:dihydrolipoamide acetyltransferase family protein [Deltaproteobacteria bacterium]
MAVDVIMPAMGATQETGRLVRWFKREGDSVTRGEMLMEVETDKSVVEVEAPASGILTKVTAGQDDEIPVGQTIALIVEPGEAVSGTREIPDAGPRRKVPARKKAKTPIAPKRAPATTPDTGRFLASPAARRLAKERGVEIAGIQGTGPEGAVVARDVLSTVEAAPATEGAQVPPSRMRRIIGERMTLSKQTAPHFYLHMDVDMTAVEARRDLLKQRGASPVPSFNDFILKAVGRALAESPSMNASWTDEGIEQRREVNLGMAVAVDDGLVVPVISNADKLPLEELALRSRELVAQAQSRRLTPANYQGGTFTVSNLGMFGVDAFTAIINPPQCGILAVGRVAPRVVPDGDAVAVRSMMTMTLSADHRVVDGAIGARFLQRVKQNLEEG